MKLISRLKPRKIVFLEPRSTHIHTYSDVPIPRLGAVLLATMAKERLGADVQVFVEDIHAIDRSVVLDADLVCISALTSTAPQAYRWAEFCRAAGIPVVLGGTHPSFLPDEALTHCDWVIRGEAEESFFNFLDCLEAGDTLAKVNGVSWKDVDGHFIHNPDQALPSSEILDRLPFPDFRLIKGCESKPPATISITTQRGCPYPCTFCSVRTFNGQNIRHPSVEWVLNALEWYAGLYGNLRWVFFNDDIHNIKRERMRALHQGMIDRGLTFPFGSQVRHEIRKHPEDLELAHRAGADRFFAGFESPWQASLDECGKREKVQDIIDTVHAFHNSGIKLHGMFVAGFANDPPDIGRFIVEFAEKHGIDSIQIMLLTMLPGSRDWRGFQERGDTLLTSDWSLFDGHHPTFVMPGGISPLKLYRVSKDFRRFYRISKAFRSLWKWVNTRDFRDLRTALIRFAGWKLTRRWPWQPENRLYLRYMESHPEATGQTYEEWQIRSEKLTIACDPSIRPTVRTFLRELGVTNIKLVPLKASLPDISGATGRLEEVAERLANWIAEHRPAHIVIPRIDFQQIGADVRQRVEALVTNWPAANQPLLVTIPATTTPDTIRQVLRRLGGCLGINEQTTASAVEKVSGN